MYKVTKCLYFEAAHFLRGYEGACQNLHGHSYKLEITFGAKNLDELGMVIDFKRIKEYAEETLKEYDHTCLNHLGGYETVNPTAERLAKVIFERMRAELACDDAVENHVRVLSVRVWETRDSYAEYTEE